MRTITTLSLVLCLAGLPLAGSPAAARTPAPAQYDQGGYDYYESYSPEQLDNLLAPIALYPDPLLAQVLVAATFPDQIEDATIWIQRYGPGDRGLDYQNWDVSVRAVAHYPAVLNMMDDKIDWTTAVGQAYVNQSTDTIASIQNLRSLARAEGNLFSTPQQQVIYDGGYIQIVPAQPQYIFVPTYDPGVIYSRRVYNGGSYGGFFSFGSGFAIGAWLNYDLDWGSRRVVYDDWQRGGGWRQRSRPYVQVNNNVYINNRYQSVVVNRTVTNRPFNVQKVDQFNSVHRDVKFDGRNRGNGNPGNGNRGNGQPGGRPDNNNDNNRNNQRTVQPQQGQGDVNRGLRGQPLPNVPAQNNNDNRNGQRGAGQDQNQRGDNQRGDNQRGVPPAAVQPAPPAQQAPANQQQQNNQRQGGNNNRGGQNPGDNVRGRGQDQAPPSVPPAAPPQQNVPRQNDNPTRGTQNQAPPARVEPARPIPPAVQPTPQPAQRPAQEVEQERRVQQQQQQQRQAAPAQTPAPPAAQPPAQQQRQNAQPTQQGGDRGGNNGRNGKDNGKGNGNGNGNKDNKDNKDGKDH